MANAVRALRGFTRSIRGRAVLFSMAVVLLALLLGSFVLLETYEGRLITNLDITLEQQVADRVQLIESGGSKDSLTTVFEEESFVWIGSPEGQVSAQGGTIFPIDNPVPDVIGGTTSSELLVEERNPSEIEREVMVLRIASASAETGQVVLAGSELEAVESAVGDLASLFAIAVPLMTALVGLLAWLTTGRALAPVAAIREQAEEIGGSTLTERVPVPDSDDEIEDLAVTVNEMLDRIERHDVAIRQFSSDASHELKSPIANIRALVETRTSTDSSWPQVQSQLTTETERLGALVENLLFLATRQDADRAVERSRVQLDEMLFAEAELRASTGEVRVAFCEIEPVSVVGSPEDLGRLVRNLVDNAVRHAASRIELSVTEESTGIILRVADDGPGIAPADRQRIFERFTRLDEARGREDGGTGLGLSIVKQIAQSHGAQVAVQDSRLGGAEFSITWPS